MIRKRSRQSLINISFLCFLFLAMLVPWADLYRFFFFAGVVPLTIWSFYKGDKPTAASSPIIIILVLLTAYLALNSFFVGQSEFNMIFRRFRWGITIVILIGSLLIVGDQWINRPRLHGRLFFLAVAVSGLAMIIPYLLIGDFSVRIAGVGILWHTIQASSILLVLWTLGLTLFSLAPDRQVKDFALVLISLAIVLIVIVLSQSRGPLLVAGITMLPAGLLFIFLLPKKHRLIPLVTVGVLIVSVASFFWSRQGLLSAYADLLAARGLSFRPEIWSAVIDQSSSTWLFGIGSATRLPDSPAGQVLLEQTGLVFAHTHNLLLEVFYAGGIIALVLLVLAMVFLMHKLMVMPVPLKVKVSGICLLGVILMVNFTDTVHPLSSPGPDWVLLWLPMVFLVVLSHCGRGKAMEDARTGA
jgi:O-antigen ligase